jgi:hypothetical protein
VISNGNNAQIGTVGDVFQNSPDSAGTIPAVIGMDMQIS